MPEASRLRSQVAEEAARLIEEQGIDFLKAKHKAASRLGATQPLIVDIAEVVAELVVFGPIAARQAPLSPVDGRPMRRLNPKRLAALLAVD